MLREAMRKSQGNLPDGRSSEDYVGKLLAMVVDEQAAREKQEACGSQHAGKCTTVQGVIQTIFGSKTTLEQAQLFLKQNPGSVESHPAFLGFMSTLKTATCSCDDGDGEGDCQFHGEDVEHTTQDLVWGVSSILRETAQGYEGGGEFVPTALGRVGTAAFAALSTCSSGSGGGEGEGAADDQKAAEKPATRSDIVSKYGHFLLQDGESAGVSSGRGTLKFNEQMIEGMIVCRALYLLQGLRQLIEKPGQAGIFIDVSDIENTACFASLIDYLRSKDGKYYVIEMESRYQLSRDVDTSGHHTSSWCAGWARVFSEALKAQALDFRKMKKAQADAAKPSASLAVEKSGAPSQPPLKRIRLKGPEQACEVPMPPPSLGSWKQFLPLPAKIFDKTLIDGVAKNGEREQGVEGVKQEDSRPAEGEKKNGDGPGQGDVDVELFSKTPTPASVYCMHELPPVKKLNALDVACIGSQIQMPLLSYATLPACLIEWCVEV